MASVGLKQAKFNQIDQTTNKYKTVTDNVPLLEKIIESKFSPEYNSAELYANDCLAESDNSFKKGTLNIVVADDKDKTCATLLGNKIAPDGTEVTSNINDSAPEFGYGHIVPKIVDGVKKWKVEFFPRVKFTKITTDRKTRGESVEFATTNIEATVLPLSKAINGFEVGDWEKHDTFDTEAAAETYLDTLLTPATN